MTDLEYKKHKEVTNLMYTIIRELNQIVSSLYILCSDYNVDIPDNVKNEMNKIVEEIKQMISQKGEFYDEILNR